VARFTLAVFAFEITSPMELITILNRCHHHQGFVYQQARFGSDKKSIEVDVRSREGSAAICSGLSFIKTSYTCKINEFAMSSFGDVG
jgi:hypothetical protein